jgi:hypothetical protein
MPLSLAQSDGRNLGGVNPLLSSRYAGIGSLVGKVDHLLNVALSCSLR